MYQHRRFAYCRNCMLGIHYKCLGLYDKNFICKCKKCHGGTK